MADYLPGTIPPSSLDCRTLILLGGKHAQGSGHNLWPQEMEHGWSKPTKLILYTFTSFLFKGKHVTKFWPMRWRGKIAGGREPFMNDPTPWLKEIGKEACTFFLSWMWLSKGVMSGAMETILWPWGNTPKD